MRTRLAQLPPAGPPMGGMPPMGDPMGGMPPMGDPMGGGMPPMGGAPPGPPPPPPRPAIPGPLKSVGEILYDFNIEEYIALHPDKDDEEIAADVWEAYGGMPNGVADLNKVGQRTSKDAQRPPEDVDADNKNTEDTKWVRLLAGDNISDTTSIDEIIGLMKSMTYGTIKKFRTPPAPPGGGMGMGMPPMAATVNKMEREAMADAMREDYLSFKKMMRKLR